MKLDRSDMVKMRARFSFQIQKRIEPMKNPLGVVASTPKMILMGLLAIGLYACSSSGSDSSAATSFSDPVDALTLRSALITGSSADDDAEYWECKVSDGSAVYEYRLMADGTGVENDLANPTVPSTFTWETNSAHTATTLVQASGMQNDLSSISFTDRDNMSLLVANSVSLACVRQGGEAEVTPEVPAGDNTLSFGGAVYELTHGFEQVYNGYLTNGRSHSEHHFRVADAGFNISHDLVSGGVSWQADDANIQFSIHLHAPGDTGSSFESGTFNFVPDTVEEQNNPELSGKYFFNKANVFIKGDESTASEVIEVVGGTISVTRQSGDIATMNFDGTLENGDAVSVRYEGMFVTYDE